MFTGATLHRIYTLYPHTLHSRRMSAYLLWGAGGGASRQSAVDANTENVQLAARQRVVVFCDERFCGETTRGALFAVPGSYTHAVFRPGSEFLRASPHVRRVGDVWRWDVADRPRGGPAAVRDLVRMVSVMQPGTYSGPDDAMEVARSWGIVS